MIILITPKKGAGSKVKKAAPAEKVDAKKAAPQTEESKEE